MFYIKQICDLLNIEIIFVEFCIESDFYYVCKQIYSK